MSRTRPDACPGALQVHTAADGPLARIRVPGGRLAPGQLQVLADAAHDLGNGEIELTARGNVQLRAVSDPNELADRLAAAGLLPSRTHDRVRNIVASPLSGRIGGLLDVGTRVLDLDEALRGSPDLASLPGRVLFSLDDGTGDVSGFHADFGLQATTPDTFALLLAGADTGVRLPADLGVARLLDAARCFAQHRTDEWRLSELEGGPAGVLATLGLVPSATPLTFEPKDPPIGWLPQDDDLIALGAGVRLGVLPARIADFIAAVEKPVVVTPWRTIVLTDLEEWAADQIVRVLAPMGLIFDGESPWLRVSACAGRPACDKAHADVRADVTAAVEQDALQPGRQHWAGCERRCGRPQGPVTDVVATETGYDVR